MAGSRPDTEEALEIVLERVEYALQVAGEAYNTSDAEDENGNAIDPIHAYATALIADALPHAILGLFVMQHRLSPKEKEPCLGQ